MVTQLKSHWILFQTKSKLPVKIQTKTIQKLVGIAKKTERVAQLSDINTTSSLTD